MRNAVVCRENFGPPPFFVLPVHIFRNIWTPRPLYFRNIWTPMHVINYSRDSEESGAGLWVLNG